MTPAKGAPALGGAFGDRLLEAAPDGVVGVDGHGLINLFNLQAEKMFGYRREEVFGKPIEMLLPLRLRDVHVRHRASYLVEPRPRPMGTGLEIAARRKDGAEFPADISLCAVEVLEGAHVVAFVRDVTDRKRAEENHLRSVETFKALVEAAPDAVVGVGPSGDIRFVNSQAERMFGYTRVELVGMSIERLLPERFREGHVGHRTGYFASPRARPMGACLELLGERKDGSDFPVDVSLTAVRADGGGLLAAAFIRDITERKRAEEKLKEAMNNLQLSNRDLEQFAYVASHDLQEPLRMIASYTQLLERRYKGRLDGEADEFIGYAVDGANRMQALINDLLSFSRVGTRGKPLEPADSEAALESALLNLEVAIEETKARVTHGPLPTVSADAGQLTQLFQNLVGNAIKFHGESPPEVHVSAARDGTSWCFTVRDNGIGIDPKHFDRLFIVFQRLHGRGEYSGTGIGLAVCKKIVERHKGRIWVESAPGKGSTFRFTIPDASERGVIEK